MSKEFSFFIYLLERYAAHLGVSADVAYRRLSQKNLVDYAINMYELYHAGAAEDGELDDLKAGAVVRDDGGRCGGYDVRVIAKRAAAERAEYHGLLSVCSRDVKDAREAAFVDRAEFVRRKLDAPIAVAAVHLVAWVLTKVGRRAGYDVHFVPFGFRKHGWKSGVALEHRYARRIDGIVIVDGIACGAMRGIESVPHLVRVQVEVER